MDTQNVEPIYVTVDDPTTRDLAPQYLARRRTQVNELRAALGAGDLSAIQVVAHQLVGSGGAYGFDEISRIARELEESALRCDPEAVRGGLAALDNYLQRVHVRAG